MSKYEVQYWSASRGDYVDIEEMQDVHLLNAWRKLEKNPGNTKHDALVLAAMAVEIAARGLDPQYPNGKPPEEPGADVEGT